MITSTELQTTLSHFHGGGTVYVRKVVVLDIFYTEGVKYLQDNAQCYWLLDAIASYQTRQFREANDFQTWKLTVNGTSAILVCEDGNDNELARQAIEWTDFPLAEIKIWVTTCDRIFLFLPSEY